MAFKTTKNPSMPALFAATEQTFSRSIAKSVFELSEPLKAGLEEIGDGLWRVISISNDAPSNRFDSTITLRTPKGKQTFKQVRTIHAVKQAELAAELWGLDVAPIISTEGEEIVGTRSHIEEACATAGILYSDHLAFFKRLK